MWKNYFQEKSEGNIYNNPGEPTKNGIYFFIVA